MQALSLEYFETAYSNTFKAIDMARVKGDRDQEKFCLNGAIVGLLQVAIMKYNHYNEAIDFLRQNGCVGLLLQFSEINNHHYELFKSGVKPFSGSYKEVYREVNIVHVAWLLDELTVANQMVAILRDIELVKYFPAGKFWGEYSRALEAFAQRTPFEPQFPKLAGIEKHWAAHIQLMSDISRGQNHAAALHQVRELFIKRQSDKRLYWSMLDGHPSCPVKWDFREASIMRYAGQNYGIVLNE